MSEALSDAQFAEHVKKNEGGSIGFFSRQLPPENERGFATSIGGAEETHPGTGNITPEQISAYKTKYAGKAAKIKGSLHGAWENDGQTTQDVSVNAKTPNQANAIGVPIGEEASYALPHTPVNKKGAKVGKYGGDVLLHTGDLGKNDVDPNFQPGTLDMKDKKGSFTKNQYKNKTWDKVGGTDKGEKVTYGDVLRKINKNRAMAIREKSK